jgi:predicted nucleotidyltransferase
MSSLGQKIRYLRKEKQLPLKVLAKYLDMDQAILSKIERGQRNVGRDKVIKLARFFKIDKDELLVLWLSDKLVNDLEGEDVALKALQVAEEQVLYRLTRKVDLKMLIPELKKIFSGFSSVNKAWVFGSFSRGDNNISSDVDILIDVPPQKEFTLFDIAEIKEQIQNVLKKEVDVVMLSAIKPQIKKQIENDLKLVYEAQ